VLGTPHNRWLEKKKFQKFEERGLKIKIDGWKKKIERPPKI
jgi:hypothetical protein